MAEGRKFAALAGIRQQQPDPAKPETVALQAAPPPPVSERAGKGGRGRPAGKRSDPEFQPTTVLLRKATKRAAIRKLEDTDARKDLSDLIEQLLNGWVKRQA